MPSRQRARTAGGAEPQTGAEPQQTGRCAHLVEAQVVHDRGRRVEDQPFRAHHQSEAVEGLEQREHRHHSHDLTSMTSPTVKTPGSGSVWVFNLFPRVVV